MADRLCVIYFVSHRFIMKGLCLIVWMLISLLFVLSIVGLIMFIPKDHWQNHPNEPSTWAKIGRDLLKAVVNGG